MTSLCLNCLLGSCNTRLINKGSSATIKYHYCPVVVLRYSLNFNTASNDGRIISINTKSINGLIYKREAIQDVWMGKQGWL